MTDSYHWVNDTTFAQAEVNNSTGQQTLKWTDQGLNSTIYKLMYNAESMYSTRYGLTTSDQSATSPTYFTPAYIAGLEVTPNAAASQQYYLLVPLVALYKINWDAYYSATGTNSTATP